MPLALALTVIAILLVIIAVLSIPVIMIRQGQGIKYVYDDNPPPAVIPGEVIEDPPDTAFFDDNDLAAAKAKQERPEFKATEVLVNGIKAGPDGTVPLAKEKGFWRR